MGGAGSRVLENERERTEPGNRIVVFMLKSHSFKLIRLQTTHHYIPLVNLCFAPTEGMNVQVLVFTSIPGETSTISIGEVTQEALCLN